MKEGTAAPWASQKINTYLEAGAIVPSLEEFIQDLRGMFEDPNCAATAHQKLSDARQGAASVKTIIQKFELYGSISGLGDAGLIDKFECAITPCLRQAIYNSDPFPVTWEDWKQEVSLLDNQHRRFDYTQLQMWPSHPFPGPPVPLQSQTMCGGAAPPHLSQCPQLANQMAGPSAHPQPMELDRACQSG
jgi:hypothetical protein